MPSSGLAMTNPNDESSIAALVSDAKTEFLIDLIVIVFLV
jgi:hypothetical protein